MSFILITTLPDGFPPEEIRKHWVGVKIPLADPKHPFGSGKSCSVNTTTLAIHKDPVYVVNAYDALQALFKVSPPEIEEWFEANGFVYSEASRCEAFARWGFKVNCCCLVKE